MFTQTKALPKVLDFSSVKFYIFSTAFTISAVFFPWLVHQFHIAGQIFLPMHFFILTAGLLFGWRTGLATGVFSVLMSYFLTQMPQLSLLPQVTLELAVYGLVIGLLREKNVNIFISLFAAMIFGRLARVLSIAIFTPQANVFEFIKIGLPGIILQILLIPIVIYLIQKFLNKDAKKI